MLPAFHFASYRAFLVARLKHQGRGALARIADHLKIHPSLVTKILKGRLDFTPDQAFALGEYLGLPPAEQEYFLTLVDVERAGSPRRRSWLKGKAAKLKEEATRAVEPGRETAPLSDRNQFIFYSHWYYSATRLLTSVPGHNSSERIAERLGLPHALIEEVLTFLLSTGLCTQMGGKLELGVRDTRIDASSPMIDRHLSNWRMKGLEKIPRSAPAQNEIFYSGPMAIHHDLRPRVRALVLELIEAVDRLRSERPPDDLACLNVDWFVP